MITAPAGNTSIAVLRASVTATDVLAAARRGILRLPEDVGGGVAGVRAACADGAHDGRGHPRAAVVAQGVADQREVAVLVDLVAQRRRVRPRAERTAPAPPARGRLSG